MKNFTILFLLFISFSAAAQNTFPTNGAAGVGTISPTTPLDVRGTISTPEIAFRNDDGGDDSDPYRLRKVRTSFNVNWLELQLNDDGDESFRIYGNSCQGYSCGAISGNLYHSFNASGNAYHSNSLAIGVADVPSGYRLAVAGKIIAPEVKVQLQTSWPDYVFKKQYILPSLASVEKHINEKGHLPAIPSAEEVKKNGIELGDMNAKLLQKIEELTLYLIEQNKKLEAQSSKLKELEELVKKSKP